jgi:hypothetical protein
LALDIVSTGSVIAFAMDLRERKCQVPECAGNQKNRKHTIQEPATSAQYQACTLSNYEL